ncbi:hypothetical protein BJV82DRAFT_610877 [Fennellomyces sp. T-0311]|nr:hypothetical protein BJV82DRAFT_610877 [Fennellomyces sp. T-0311]
MRNFATMAPLLLGTTEACVRRLFLMMHNGLEAYTSVMKRVQLLTIYLQIHYNIACFQQCGAKMRSMSYNSLIGETLFS